MKRKLVAIAILSFLIFSIIMPYQMRETVKNDSKENIKITNRQNVRISYVDMSEELVKNCVEKEVATLDKQDYEMLCRTVFCEAGNQDIHTQTMVALTILNRVKNKKFPDTVRGVIYQKNAYAVTTWKNFEQYKWTKQVEKAVDNAIKENKHPENMFYFRTGHFHRFGKPYVKSGDLWFSTEN